MLSPREVVAMHRTTFESLTVVSALGEAVRMAEEAEAEGNLEYSVLVLQGETGMAFASVEAYRMATDQLITAGLPEAQAADVARNIINQVLPNALSRMAALEAAMAYNANDDATVERKLAMAAGMAALQKKNEKE